MPDPYTFLNLFVGLPFNYRKSVLAEFSVLQEHRLEQIICKNPALEVIVIFRFFCLHVRGNEDEALLWILNSCTVKTPSGKRPKTL